MDDRHKPTRAELRKRIRELEAENRQLRKVLSAVGFGLQAARHTGTLNRQWHPILDKINAELTKDKDPEDGK